MRSACEAGGFDILGESPVHRASGDLLLNAHHLAPFFAELALPASPIQPGHAHSIAWLQIGDPVSCFLHFSNDLVTQDERGHGDGLHHLPIAVGQVRVGMANPAGFHADQHFSSCQLRHRSVFKLQALADFAQHCCFHFDLQYRIRFRLDLLHALTAAVVHGCVSSSLVYRSD